MPATPPRLNPVNPFIDLTRDELSREMVKAVGVLEARQTLTAEERAAFAERLRYLLIAATDRLSCQRLMPGAPAFQMARMRPNDDAVAIYATWIARETESARYSALQDVGERVMSPTTLARWLVERRDCLTSDEGWRAAMAALLAMKPLR